MSATRLPSVFGLLVLLAGFDLVLRLGGMGRALRLAEWLGGLGGTARDSNGMGADLVGERVATAAAFYPRRALCLEQSLTLYVALKRAGVDARLRVGVRPMPFAAHAWVEVNGQPVYESIEFVSQLAAFPGIGG